jgi:hypothetical protein
VTARQTGLSSFIHRPPNEHDDAVIVSSGPSTAFAVTAGEPWAG